MLPCGAFSAEPKLSQNQTKNTKGGVFKMGLELYMMFNVSHSSQENARSAIGAIDYAEREEMQDLEKEIEDIKEKTTGIDYIERQRTSDILDLEGKMKLMQDYKSDFVTSKSFNIPSWAEGKDVRPSKYFFRSSEKNEPPGWNNYHEFKITIPNETTNEQAMKMGQKIMNKSGLGKNAYTIAIHDKEASLSIDGVHNRHLHIVFSDRIQDEHNRSEEQYFKQYRPKNIDKGGCQKDTRFTVGIKQIKENTKEIRRNVADVINEFYKENDIDKHVDARTKEEMLAEATKNKDYNLMELLSVENQEHMGGYQIELLKNPNKFVKEVKSLQNEMAKLIVIKEQIQITGSIAEKLPELEKYINEYRNRINNVIDKIKTLDEIVSARFDVEKRTQPIIDNKPIKVSVEKFPSAKELDKQIEKVSKKIGTLEKTVSSMLNTLNTKDKTQAIKDRQTIEGMSGNKLVHNVVEELPSVKELEKQIAEYTLHINKITDRIQGRINEAKEIINSDIVGVKALHLDITIENKTRAISTNIEKSCLREYMSSIKRLPDYLEYDRNIRSLAWHKEQIAEKKTDLKNIKLSDRKELNITKNRIGALERNALALETKITNFNKKYVTDNPKIEEFRPQVLANNLSLEKHIAKLKDRKKELLNPFLKDVVADRELLAEEYSKFSEVKEAFLKKGEPVWYEPEEIATWKEQLKSFDKLAETFTDKERAIDQKATKKIEGENENGQPRTIQFKPRVKQNARWGSPEDGMCSLHELDVVTDCKDSNLLLPSDFQDIMGRQDESGTDRLRRVADQSGIIDEQIKTIDNQCEYFHTGITISQALKATEDKLSELKKELNAIDYALKKNSENYISTSTALEMAKIEFVGTPLHEAQREKNAIKLEEKYIQTNKDDYSKNSYTFSKLKKPEWYENSSSYKEKERELKKEYETIAKREADLSIRKINNDRQFELIEIKCKTPIACSEIEKMAQKLLTNNKPFADRKSTLIADQKEIETEIKTFSIMRSTFEKAMKNETARNKKDKKPEIVFIARVKVIEGRGHSCGSGNNAPEKGLLAALASTLGAILPKNQAVGGLGAINLHLDDEEEYDFSAMTPEQIETAMREISIKNAH